MRIYVIGAGAVGSIFGGYLSLGGHEVTLVESRPETRQNVERHGLRIEGLRGELCARPRIVEQAGPDAAAQLVMVCTKAYDTAAAVDQHRALFGADTLAMSLQNGIGNVEALAERVGGENVLAGTTTSGGYLVEPGRVCHAGQGLTVIGESRGGESQRAQRIAKAFCDAGIQTEVSQHIDELLWSKLCVNVAINPLTALLGVPNGVPAQYEPSKRLMLAAVDEAVDVAASVGVLLDREQMRERALEVARLTADNRSSMLGDLAAGRRTEIDFINGAVARVGAQHGVDTPVNRVLAQLVRAAELTMQQRANNAGTSNLQRR
ncbi:MAG: ketopantoate reductase family protein [Candidatus Alcyoniella australis]|nr:ketopantoate reductase family protein [Candidatus Alcyoniella australis]